MQRTGVANLPLHPGKAPRWLFKRMVALSREITEVIVYEYGRDEFLRRISDPFWFQALSCVLGYDWHSSGCTTVTCGALKEAIDPQEFGLAITGGKGKISRKTPEEIEKIGELYNLSTTSIKELQYSSRMTAKVDNTAIQDGYDLYHHVLIFSEKGKWAVIQQGMCDETSYARRYHWFSENMDSFVCEPHKAIVGNNRQERVLDMTAKQSVSAQKISVDLVNDNPQHLKCDWTELTRSENQRTLDNWLYPQQNKQQPKYLDMPQSIDWQKMREIYDFQPKNYEELLAIKGVGPKTIRALALISDLIYGEKPSWEDPIRYTFAHGGKDGVPHPVDLSTYSHSIEMLEDAIKKAKLGEHEQLYALKRLRNATLPTPINPSLHGLVQLR
ncbi:MAG: DUF763 domain-containing protein [Candidatus Thermoplasmatota archaeon]|nr:DUF763 domain-containing protein [Candidatus Thermoplasmatota archaeon]